MTTISANVIADSIGADAPRLTTLHLRYPRFIHSEVLRHRVFSGNARSSRAVPIAKLIEEVENDPVIPLHWGAAQAGMQAYQENDAPVVTSDGDCGNEYFTREGAWLEARDAALLWARAFGSAGYAKQLVNRILEPFVHIDHLITSTEWSNFFALRDHHAAEPHIQMLAREIRKAMEGSEPAILTESEWHLPYVASGEGQSFDKESGEYAQGNGGSDDHDRICSWLSQNHGGGSLEDVRRVMAKLSAARCARISYKPFEGDGSIEADIALADKLAESGHWSPFEHAACPDSYWNAGGSPGWAEPDSHGNFTGWRQSRRLLEAERARRAAA